MITFQQFKKAIKNPLRALSYLTWIGVHYSQTWEDLILDFLTMQDTGFYIDIGGNHPISWNNTYWFYKKWWTGINVEPNKKLIKKFNSKRPKDQNLQIWIGKQNSELEFFVLDCDSMSTCDKETVKRYESVGYKVVDSYIVPIWTLERLYDEYVWDKKIDILSVDVEWLDMDVLMSNNWDKYRPTYIILETVEYGKHGKLTWIKQNDIFDPYLESKWYVIVAETWINTIYKNNLQ
jgi:FkbM family methyltransferase